MTEQPNDRDAGAQINADGQTGTPEVSTPESPESHSGSKLHREAANYRTQRNEAREALAAAEARIEAFQTREVERLAAEKLSNPADLMALGGVALADLLDDDGEIDPEKVDAVAAEILDSRPGLHKQRHPSGYDPTQGIGGNPGKAQPTWGDLLA